MVVPVPGRELSWNWPPRARTLLHAGDAEVAGRGGRQRRGVEPAAVVRDGQRDRLGPADHAYLDPPRRRVAKRVGDRLLNHAKARDLAGAVQAEGLAVVRLQLDRDA